MSRFHVAMVMATDNIVSEWHTSTDSDSVQLMKRIKTSKTGTLSGTIQTNKLGHGYLKVAATVYKTTTVYNKLSLSP